MASLRRKSKSIATDDPAIGWRPASIALLAATFLMLLLALTLPVALALLRHWSTYLPENALPILLTASAIALLLGLAILVVVLRNLGLTDQRYALGLPEGSIRAVIALMLILLFFISSIFLYSNGRRTSSTVLDPVSRAIVNAIPPTDLISVQPSKLTKGLFRVERRADTAASDDLAKQLITTISTLVVAVAAFYFGANSVAQATRSLTRGTDGGVTGEELATRIRAVFAGQAFSGVQVSVVGSTAILTGGVASETLIHEAEQAVLSIPGVESVDASGLGIAPEAETPEAETPEAETPEAETPEAETPEAETPEAETPETETLETPGMGGSAEEEPDLSDAELPDDSDEEAEPPPDDDSVAAEDPDAQG